METSDGNGNKLSDENIAAEPPAEPYPPPPSPLVLRFDAELESLLVDHEGEFVLYTRDGGRQFGDDEMTLYRSALEQGYKRSQLFIARVAPAPSGEICVPYYY